MKNATGLTKAQMLKNKCDLIRLRMSSGTCDSVCEVLLMGFPQ